jgi:hypothetical protein
MRQNTSLKKDPKQEINYSRLHWIFKKQQQLSIQKNIPRMEYTLWKKLGSKIEKQNGIKEGDQNLICFGQVGDTMKLLAL